MNCPRSSFDMGHLSDTKLRAWFTVIDATCEKDGFITATELLMGLTLMQGVRPFNPL